MDIGTGTDGVRNGTPKGRTMKLSRRDFIKGSGVGIGGVVLLDVIGGTVAPAKAEKSFTLNKKVGETSSICAYCAGGCGILVSADGKNVISIEGDPDHPINQGALCSKAQSLYQIRTVDGNVNPMRLTKVRYRAPNSTDWEEKSWDWALSEIANRIKKTRDASFIEKDGNGVTVNRTEAIAQLGGSAHDNEEAYLIAKMDRGLGLVYMETQARI
jgi:formate dehydrogenase major subunit